MLARDCASARSASALARARDALALGVALLGLLHLLPLVLRQAILAHVALLEDAADGPAEERQRWEREACGGIRGRRRRSALCAQGDDE